MLRVPQHGSWSGWLSYTWSQVEDRINGRAMCLVVGISGMRSRPWTATLANSYHSGWPTAALSFDSASVTPQVFTTFRNRSRFAAFNSLDLRVTRVFTLNRGVLEVFAEVTNATPRENPCCVEYEAVTDSSGNVPYRADTDTWLPFVPNAGVLRRY